MGAYKTIVFRDQGQPFKQIAIAENGTVLSSTPAGSFGFARIWNPDVGPGEKVQISPASKALCIHQPVVAVINDSGPNNAYWVRNKAQLDYALKGWYLLKNPHANLDVMEADPSVKAVRDFFSCCYVTDPGMGGPAE